MKYSPEQFISIVFLQAAIQFLMKSSPEFYDKLFLQAYLLLNELNSWLFKRRSIAAFKLEPVRLMQEKLVRMNGTKKSSNKLAGTHFLAGV